jgi:hypothetical protein
VQFAIQLWPLRQNGRQPFGPSQWRALASWASIPQRISSIGTASILRDRVVTLGGVERFLVALAAVSTFGVFIVELATR